MFQNKHYEDRLTHRTGPEATLRGRAVRLSGRGALWAAVTAAAVIMVSGCYGNSSAPAATTISLTVNGNSVTLAGLSQKCYDYQGHLMLEAWDPANSNTSNFLMDYYQNGVSLSIGIRGGSPPNYDYQAGQNGQSAVVTRNGNTVSVSGIIGVALDDTKPPVPFSIKAECAKFFNTPPDSSYVGTPGTGPNGGQGGPAVTMPSDSSGG